MMEQRAKYPVGIQTFEKIRKGGYLYIDKTKYVYDLANSSQYVFLSRPRRFGKSLLTSTFNAYFSGRKDLFNGLAIGNLEKDWTEYPVLSFSLASAKMGTVEDLEDVLDEQLYFYEKKFGITSRNTGAGTRMSAMVKELFSITGRQAVILIDEYDSPMLTVLHDKERLEHMRTALQSFYAPLKDLDPYLRFVFITGITKFSQLSVFSQLNNLVKISMMPEYSAICGITQEELEENFEDGIVHLGQRNGMSQAEVLDALKNKYDGYHFSHSSPGVYNPFSLLSAMYSRELHNYWFETGTPGFLISQLRKFGTDITRLDGSVADASEFDAPTEDMHSILPLLYQSGYLTIKNYDNSYDEYILGFPNEEVKVGFTRMLIPFYVSSDTNGATNACRQICRALTDDHIDAALTAAQSFFAAIPYQEGTLKNAPAAEGHFTAMLYVMFSFLNRYVWSQVRVALGRMDILVKTVSTIYVMELKLDGSVEEALKQIDNKGYAIPWKEDGRKVVKVGISFSSEKRTISEWKVRQSA
ncbi:MAG: ATP-binding protein [Succinivibrionaceae bacterium]|nr:ATP-binding protein [Succinivibrionaceae bacterium]MDY6336463.1 ATP-binding protein [Succinivibrionaceae bacterium]